MTLKRLTYKDWSLAVLNFVVGIVGCTSAFIACTVGRPILALVVLTIAVCNFTEFVETFPTEPT